MNLQRHYKHLTEDNQWHSNWLPHKCTGEIQWSKTSARGRITSMWEYVALKHFLNEPMVPSPRAIPDHIEPIENSKIKYKTFSTSGIGGGFGFQEDTLCTPIH